MKIFEGRFGDGAYGFSYLWLVGNGRMVVIVVIIVIIIVVIVVIVIIVIIVPHSSIPY